MRTLRPVAIVLLAMGLTGCGFVMETVAREVFGSDVRHPGLDEPALGFGSLTKTVANKVVPLTLVARDGSTCVVPKARFDQIRIGQTVVCVWSTYSYRVGVFPRH